jgi:alkylation response protein AidB-like acyl-CoA dehydrogenase
MNNSHPSSVLKQKYTDIIRDSAARAEKDGKLTKAQLGLTHEQHWFKMLTPSSLSGLQMPLPEALRMAEALAWADGSTGWEISLGAGAGWLAGFAETEIAKKIFGDAKLSIAGIADVAGTAEKTKNGYTLNGKWAYVGGAHEAAVFAINCILVKGGVAVKNETTNEPQLLSFLLSKEEVSLTPAGNVMGLSAAANHHMEVKGLAVAAERAIKTGIENAKVDAPLYKFPYIQLLEAFLAINISGMAIHFMDLCEPIFAEQKNRNGVPLAEDRTVKELYEKQIQKLDDARTKLVYAIELSWQSSTNFRQIKPAIVYKVSAASYELSRKARECVEVLFPYCGIEAADKTTEINRVWRDLHTASQHSLLVFGSLPE